MKTQGKVWVIYDPESKKQSKPMSVVQAQVVILSLKKKELGRHFIWTPGWTEWVRVDQFLASEQKYFTDIQPPKPGMATVTQTKSVVQETEVGTVTMTTTSEVDALYTVVNLEESTEKQEFGFYAKDFNGDELDISKIQKIKPSAKKNISNSKKDSDGLKIELLLVTKKSSFRTYTKAISMSGATLAEDLPLDFMKESFDLIITNPFEKDKKKSHLHIRAKIKADLKSSRRLIFAEQDQQMLEQLKAFLSDYLRHQKIEQPTG